MRTGENYITTNIVIFIFLQFTLRVVKLRVVRLAVHVTRMEEMRNVYKPVFRNTEGNRLFVRARCR